MLLWVNNHFNDFEGDAAMTRFLEEFERLLEVTVRAHSNLNIEHEYSFFFFFLFFRCHY